MCKGDLPAASSEGNSVPPKAAAAATTMAMDGMAREASISDLSSLLPRPVHNGHNSLEGQEHEHQDRDTTLSALRDVVASDANDNVNEGGGVISDGPSRRPSLPVATTAATRDADRRHSQPTPTSSRRSSTMETYRRSSVVSTSSMGLASFSHLSNFLADEGLSSRRRSSIGSLDSDTLQNYQQVGEDELDEDAAEALKDFALQLRFYGKDALDETTFNNLLDDIGHNPQKREGLFDDFLDEVARASLTFDPTKRAISVDDLRYVYRSEPYRLPRQANFSNGEALMGYVESLFRQADVTGDNALDREEMRAFLDIVFEREPTDEELKEAMDTFDVDGDGKIDLDEFKSFILRANINDTSNVCGDFNEGLLSPSHASEEEFVDALEQYALSHRAVTHHLLDNLACASFGWKDTADMLLRFLSAYTRFNSRFLDNVQALMEVLDDERHVEVLTENLEEEMGQYDEETLVACEEVGIPRESVEGIPHRTLFKLLLEFVETVLQRSYGKFIPDYVCQELNDAVTHATKLGRLGLLAALYFGSELIVPKIYSSILSGLRSSIGVSNKDARFLVLHIDMDQDHATALREIILANCQTKADRLTLVQCTRMLLDGRVAFYDALIKHSSLDPMACAGEVGNECHGDLAPPRRTMNARMPSERMIGEEPINGAGDLTGAPAVLAMCEEHAKGAMVLDVGCGDGRNARRLIEEHGAAKVVGVDGSEEMVEEAQLQPLRGGAGYFVEGDVSNLKETLLRTSNKTNIMPGAGFDVGLFDLSVSVYTLNSLTITDMTKTFRDIFSLLKPGGHFVFSVPHPFMSNHDGENFGFAQGKSGKYFALRDKFLEGHISTQHGERLKVSMYCKTFEDYMKSARRFGFEIVELEETRVGQDQLKENPLYYEAMNGIPLHLVVKLRKPSSQTRNIANNLSNNLNMLPRKLNWSSAAQRHPENAFIVHIPERVKRELYKMALNCFDKGITVDDLDATGIASLFTPSRVSVFAGGTLSSLKSFAASVRNVLLHETGLVLLKGLDLDVFGSDSSEKMVACSKIAYYLICNHIGAVDGSARGRLFDVKDNHIDAMDEKSDNILFSVSNCKANWHTDGASKDKVYEAVALLCIHPASVGGCSMVSNACNAYDSLASRMPKFMMSELHRPVTRDILENGTGTNTHPSVGLQLSRANCIMSLRMSYNSYPIYDRQPGRIRFRYMRHWIQSSHMKMRWKVPTLLRIAMDVLDDTLDEGCCFHEPLQRGDVLICNNACIAHGRDSFQDEPGKQSRHLVRAWMQMQGVDLMKPSNNQSAVG